MLLSLLILIASLAALIWAADLFVDAVVVLAKKLEVSAMVIGLTVVAIGTSLPEAAASVVAAIEGYPQIAFGNVIGSNICNVALILGLPAVFIAPLVCDKRTLNHEGWLMIGITFVVWGAAEYFFELPRALGIVFVLGFFGYLIWVFWFERAGENTHPNERQRKSTGTYRVDEILETATVAEQMGWTKLALRLLGSLVVIIFSSDFLVGSTVELAILLGVSETVIALSMVALGTSLPELSVSIAAARKKEGGILIGNILGSNISNLLLVLGLATAINPFQVNPVILNFDLPLMVFTSLLMLLFLYQKKGINLPKGLVLLGLYGLLIWRCFAFPV